MHYMLYTKTIALRSLLFSVFPLAKIGRLNIKDDIFLLCSKAYKYGVRFYRGKIQT